MLPTLIIGVLLLGLLGLAGALVLFVMRRRVCLPEVVSLETATFPAEQLTALQPLAQRLEGEGFVFAGVQRERRGGADYWQALFQASERAIWAVVERTGTEGPRVVFHTFFESGRLVTTSEGEFADFDVTDQWRLNERRWPELADQLTAHRQAVLGGGADVLAVGDSEQFAGCYRRAMEGEIAHLESLGVLTPREAAGEYGLRPWRSPGVALQMLFHSPRNRLAEKSRVRDAQYQAELDAEAAERKQYGSLGEYKYLEYYKKDKERGNGLAMLGWTVKGAFLTVSIVALILIAWVQGAIDPLTIGIIAAILVIHELGHVAAMIGFGYRDLHVLFLPLLGNLAPERNLRVPAWQEFVVLLMGPLPGLVVGVGLMVSGFLNPDLPEVWKTVGLWATLINYLNFLAVAPYDGGRVINLLVFERVPALRVLYAIGSALAMIALCFLMWAVAGSPPLILLIPAISAFVALPDNWRMAKMAPWARHNLHPRDSEIDALMKAFQIVEQTDSVKGLEKKGWTNFVDRVVRYGCSEKMGVVGTVAAFVLFFSFLATPLVGIVAVGAKEGRTQAQEQKAIEEKMAPLAGEVSWESIPVTRAQRDLLDGLLTDYLQLQASNHLGEEQVGGGAIFEMPSVQVQRDGVSLPTIRKIKWGEAASWAAEEDTLLREGVLEAAVRTLALSAEEEMAYGSRQQALADAGKAYYALVHCEPRTSLGGWIDWLSIEEGLLQTLEQAGAEEALPLRYNAWFASTLRSHDLLPGKTLAYLLLQELRDDGARLTPAEGEGESAGLSVVMRGTPLRRSKADEPLNREAKLRPTDLASTLALVRLAQGRPTSADVEAGLQVASALQQGGLESAPWESLKDEDQRERWEARIEYVQRVVHLRKLAVAALDLEVAYQRPAPVAASEELVAPAPIRVPPPLVEFEMVETGRGRQLVSVAPEGTRLTWRLSANVIPRPVPSPVPAGEPASVPAGAGLREAAEVSVRTAGR